jgi:hypothetical protein
MNRARPVFKMLTSLDILLDRFRHEISELGFEVSEKGFSEMRKYALDGGRLIRLKQKLDGKIKTIHDLYHSIIILEANTDFLESRYPDY